jgi:hypothetical protein
MPLAISPAIRRAILHRTQRGQATAQIALELQLCERTVRHLLHQLRSCGAEALQPGYDTCGQHRQRSQEVVHRRTLQLREQHPRWGAGRLLVQLKRIFPERELPSERTLQRWLRGHGDLPAPAGRPASERRPRSSVVHEVWQIDAAEQKRLANGAMISWLRVYEECSGAVLQTVVFSRRTLQLRTAGDGAIAFEAGFHQARTTSDRTRGQRFAVGIGQRFAAGVGIVAGRLGHRDAVESAVSSPRQRHRRARTRLGEKLGRAAVVPQCCAASAAHE